MSGRPWSDAGPQFSGWNVAVAEVAGTPGVLDLSFDSTLLGRRTRNLIWMPAGYDQEPVPVTYFLHGTISAFIHPAWERFAHRLVDRGVNVPWGLRPVREATVRPDSMDFDAGAQRFLVVAPDAGGPHWCTSCNWVDGVRKRGVAAESHLYEELFPLIEAMFRVRTDRGGRAIIGHSMGGGGAMIQGFRHPDRFAFAGSSSGTLTLTDDLVSRLGVRWLIYNRSQGFRPVPVDEILYRSHDLLELAPQVIGTGLEIVIVVGDGTPTGEVRPGNPLSPGQDAKIETHQRRNNDLIAFRLMEAGVPLTYIRRQGLHSIGASTFRLHFLDRLHTTFESQVSLPERFTYKSIEPRFSVWGFDFAVERPNREFLNLLRARTDGRDITLAGTGSLHMRTPAVFRPGAGHRVTITPSDGVATTARVDAGDDGRIDVRLELGPARRADERRAAVAKGSFGFPQTRVEIDG